MAFDGNSDLLWARQLRKQGDLATSREMLGANADHDTTLRSYLLQTLGDARDADTRELLAEYLAEDPEVPVRSMAAQSLGRMGSSWAVPPLLNALTDEAATVREAAALSLGAIGDPKAVHALCELLGADASAMTRAGAAVALGEIGDPAATAALVAALDDDRLIVRRDAVVALTRAGRGGEARQALERTARSVRNVLIHRRIKRAIRELS